MRAVRRSLLILVVLFCPLGACSHDDKSGSEPPATTARSTTSTAAVTTTTAAIVTYQVQRGDTLAAIAQRFRVSVSKLVELNQLANPDLLTENQTLRIPPPPPLALVVTPASAEQGRDFEFTLTGAVPLEEITFEVDSPEGKYTGPAHNAAEDGTVTAIYRTSLSDEAGDYVVIARGNQGTTAQSGFVVEAIRRDTTSTTPE
ncbi:MAG TPA: LysM domain-containing protein [Acidimicrobiia bacterium]|nr:LysM domain-containing protein [Acidimicrobiia bacterium]